MAEPAAAAPPRPTAAPRRPTRARRAARRSAALALAAGCLASLAPVAGAVSSGAGAAPVAAARYSGQVTDALRTPTHRLAASPASGRATADLVFADAQAAQTVAHACVRRLDVAHVRSCFEVRTGAAGVETVTPLRFPPGRYVARWSVAGRLVAHWRFAVVAG